MIYKKLLTVHKLAIDKWVDSLYVNPSYIDGTKKDEDIIWEDKCDKAVELIEADGLINYIELLDEDADDVNECDWFTIEQEAIAYIDLVLKGC